MKIAKKSQILLVLNSLKVLISERPFVVTKSSKRAYALLGVAAFPCLVQNAHAYLGGFELADGYSTTPATVPAHVISGAGGDEVAPNGNTGAEVHTYNAGNGTSTLTNITNNSGLWQQLYAARGAAQTYVFNNGGGGASSDTNKLGSQDGTGDRAYISTHTLNNLPSGYYLPTGTTAANLGSALLAVRSEAFGYASGDTVYGNPTNEGPNNLRFAYTPDSKDFLGLNPAALTGTEKLSFKFIAKLNIATTDEYNGTPTGLLGSGTPADPYRLPLSTVNNTNLRPLEMTFGGTVSGATIINPAFKIGWTDENNLAYWNGGSWVETALYFNYKGFDEVTIDMNLATDKFDLRVRRHDNGYVQETAATNLSFANVIGTNFGVIGFETFEDPDSFNAASPTLAQARTANGVPKTYIENFVFTAVPEPSSYGLINLGFLVGLIALRRRRVKD